MVVTSGSPSEHGSRKGPGKPGLRTVNPRTEGVKNRVGFWSNAEWSKRGRRVDRDEGRNIICFHRFIDTRCRQSERQQAVRTYLHHQDSRLVSILENHCLRCVPHGPTCDTMVETPHRPTPSESALFTGSFRVKKPKAGKAP